MQQNRRKVQDENNLILIVQKKKNNLTGYRNLRRALETTRGRARVDKDSTGNNDTMKT